MLIKEITYSCGHVGEEERSDITPARVPGWKEWVKGGGKMCKECYFKDLQNKNSKLADEQARILGLPPLQGSPKQVAWATSIRLKILSGPPLIRAGSKQYDPVVNSTARDILPIQEEKLAEIRNKDSAKWWIESREKTLEDIILDELREIVKKRAEESRDFGPKGPSAADEVIPEIEDEPEGGPDATSPF